MHFLGESQCFKENCKYSHGTTSLSELYRYLNSCRKSMDVCVYVMTSVELAGIVLSMHKRGVSVRVITDDEQEKIAGSQIWSLRKAGIVVRTDTRPTSCITSLSSLMARSSWMAPSTGRGMLSPTTKRTSSLPTMSKWSQHSKRSLKSCGYSSILAVCTAQDNSASGRGMREKWIWNSKHEFCCIW